MAAPLTSGVGGIVDAWMQHPSAEFIRDPMFDSGVAVGLLCAWWGPSGPLIGNDEVAKLCAAHPGRFVGVASVDLHRPMDAVRELRRCVRDLGFKALRMLPWL